VSRRTQAVLAAQDQALLQAGALRAGSVAIQGLPSLEYALFGGDGALLAPASEAVARPASTSTATRASTAIATSATTPEQAPAPYTPASAYRCAYATAVALNVAGLAGEIAQAWGPAGQMAQDFRSPGPQN